MMKYKNDLTANCNTELVYILNIIIDISHFLSDTLNSCSAWVIFEIVVSNFNR